MMAQHVFCLLLNLNLVKAVISKVYRMNKIICILLFSAWLLADGQAPTFMPIEPSEDFYTGSDVTMEIQVSDQSTIKDILVFYRFESEESFSPLPMNKEIFYTAIIPGISVSSGDMEYYFFARDEHGNQSTWPLGGEEIPATITILDQLEPDNTKGDITIDLLHPLPNSTSSDGSIIILSLYDPKTAIEKNEIILLVDNKDVSETLFTSSDLVTYVPILPLSAGDHTIQLQLADADGISFNKKYNFTISSVELSLAEKINWKEKAKFKGNIGYNSNYDEYFGKERPANRPLDSHKLNASMKFSFGRIKVKSSALINTHIWDENALATLERSQPKDRIKIGLRSPLIDLNYGDYSTEYSELTLKGTRIRGTYLKLKLGPWHTSYINGNTKEQIVSITKTDQDSTSWTEILDDDSTFVTYAEHTKGNASRKMNAFRTELSFSKINFGINALSSYDDLNQFSIPYNEFNNKYTFLGNAVVGTDFTILLNNKKTQFKAETAISITNDLQGMSIDTLAVKTGMSDNMLSFTKDLFQQIEDVVGFHINSDLVLGSGEGRGISVPMPNMDSLDIADYIQNDLFKRGTYRLSFRTPIRIKENSIDILTEYKRIPSNFVSFGNSSIQSDIQGLKSSVRARLLNSKLSLKIGYDNYHDNLIGKTSAEKLKNVTTTSITSSFGFGLSIPGMPSINYSIRQMDREGISIENNLLSTSNTTVTHTFNPLYKFDIYKNMNINLNGNFMFMIYTDNLYDPIVDTQNSNFATNSYTGSLNLRFKSPLSINMGGGISINSPEDITQTPTEFIVISSKIGYKFWDKTLNTYIGINIVDGYKIEEIDNSKFTIKIGAQYKLSKNINLGINADYLSLIDELDTEKNFSQIKGKVKFKISF